MSAVLDSLLVTIRQHEGYRELLNAVERPRIRPFVKSKAANVEQSRSEWVFESGQLMQHEQWLQMLSGTVPHDGEVSQEN
jgi:hypothetical protein